MVPPPPRAGSTTNVVIGELEAWLSKNLHWETKGSKRAPSPSGREAEEAVADAAREFAGEDVAGGSATPVVGGSLFDDEGRDGLTDEGRPAWTPGTPLPARAAVATEKRAGEQGEEAAEAPPAGRLTSWVPSLRKRSPSPAGRRPPSPKDGERWLPSNYGAPLELRRTAAGNQEVTSTPVAAPGVLPPALARVEESARAAAASAEAVAGLSSRLGAFDERMEALLERAAGHERLAGNLDLLRSDPLPLDHAPRWLLGSVALPNVLDFLKGDAPPAEEEPLSTAIPALGDELRDLHPATGSGREVMLQCWNWESWREDFYERVGSQAEWYADLGFSMVWMPPFTDSVSPEGYMPGDLYNLDSKYGSREELQGAIRALQSRGLKVIGDTVVNHRCAQFQDENGVWNRYGGKMDWDQKAIVGNDPSYRGRGNRKSEDIWSGAPNIDHSQEFVARDLEEWMRWLRNDIGFDGYRFDYARGINGRYVKRYVEAGQPLFCVGEFWDALDYEGTTPKHNQDAHRQRIVDWIDAAGTLSSAFDMTTKGILHAALEGNNFWRLRDDAGRAPGLLGWWPSRTVTFLENHDTGSTQGHWRFPDHALEMGYAYILTHPGTPCVFYDHLYQKCSGAIEQLLELRKRNDLHCRSQLVIAEANHECYAAVVDGKVAVKIGHGHWQPDLGKFRFSASGANWVVWELH